MKDWSENLAIALVYVGFFGLIGWAVWITESAWPLWGLVFAPSIKKSNDDDE